MGKIILNNGKTVFWNGKTFIGFQDYTYSGRYLIDFGSSSYQMNGNWNNITSTSESLSSIIDNSGKTSSIGVTVVSGFTTIGTNGDSLTGTTYPTKAIIDAFYTTSLAYYKIVGLNNDKEYDFNFFGLRIGGDVTSGTTKYSIGNYDVYLDNYNNFDNIVTIPNVTPINNEIIIKIEKVDGVFGVLSVLDIVEKTPVTYESSSIDSIQVVLQSVPTTPTNVGVIKTPFRYDKQYAYSYSWDDGVPDQYTYGFKYLNGGVAGDSNYYSGKTYTDGCGNLVKFNVGLAFFSLNGAGVDIHDGAASISWEQIAEMFDAGWGMYCHQYQDAAGASIYQVEKHRSYVRLQTSGFTTSTQSGATVKIFTQNATNYMADTVWSITGMTKLYSYENANNYQWFGGGKEPHLAGIVDWDYVDGSNRIGYDVWPRDNLGVYRYNNVSESDIITVMNKLTGSTENNKYHTWRFGLTHAVAGGGGGYGSFGEFKNAMDYLENNYGSKGNDRLWMACNQDVYEYLYVRGVTDVGYTLNDNILDVSISSQNTNSANTMPDDLRTYALTLKVTGATISNIIINGGTGCTYNTSYDTDTGLINLKWIGNLNQPTNYDYANYFVPIAEQTTLTADKEIAQDYVSAMVAGSDKTSFQARLDAI